MKHVPSSIPRIVRRAGLAGVTLTEVMVSMVIMSIGVILLSTLLPISILRTAQATQLTSATMLRNNAEAMVESNLGMLNNLQINSFQGSSQTPWNTVVDPLGYFLSAGGSTSVSFGSASTVPPATRLPRASGLSGFNIYQGAQTLTAAQEVAALTLADRLATLPDSWNLVREILVSNYAPGASPPTVTTSYPTTDLNVRNGQNLFNASHRMVLYDITGKFAVIRPICQTAVNGLGSNDLSWQNVDSMGNPIAVGPMPVGFTPRRVRIESQERRFSWLMTVRKQWVANGTELEFLAVGPNPPALQLRPASCGPDGQPGWTGVDDDGNGTIDDATELRFPGTDDDQRWVADINVAVFFNRSFRPNDEMCHVITFPINGGNGLDNKPGIGGVDDDGDGTFDNASEVGWLGSDDNRTINMLLANKPPLKKGGFILEPSQLQWYRIVGLTYLDASNTVQSDSAGAVSVNILLDQDVRFPPGGTVTQGIVMKGIVDVYSLGIRTGAQ